MTRHVLVAIDDTAASRRAFEYALAEFPDAAITALHVFDATHPAQYADSTGWSVDRSTSYEIDNRERGRELLKEAARIAAERDREIETALEPGTATGEIVSFAADADADHLVVGTRERRDRTDLLRPSVAARVAKRAPVPVTVVE